MIQRQRIIKLTMPIPHVPKEELPLKLSDMSGYSTLFTPDNESLPDSLKAIIGLMLHSAELDLGCAYKYMLDVAEGGQCW
jgi:hypothetical protein